MILKCFGSGLPDIDLDATAVQFTGDQLFDLAFYNNLRTRDGSVVHLGDNLTGRGDGDDEALTVDLGRVHPPVDTIVLMVTATDGPPQLPMFSIVIGTRSSGKPHFLVRCFMMKRFDW